MEENGNVAEGYKIANCDESWNDFIQRYRTCEVEISLVTATSGKHAVRLIRDNGFSVHLADSQSPS